MSWRFWGTKSFLWRAAWFRVELPLFSMAADVCACRLVISWLTELAKLHVMYVFSPFLFTSVFISFSPFFVPLFFYFPFFFFFLRGIVWIFCSFAFDGSRMKRLGGDAIVFSFFLPLLSAVWTFSSLESLGLELKLKLLRLCTVVILILARINFLWWNRYLVS